MLLTLKVTCGHAALAKIIAATDGVEQIHAIGIENEGADDLGAVASALAFMNTPASGNATPSTSTGNGTPAPSAPISAAPMPTAPTPPSGADDDDGDEEGDDSDGSGLDADGLPWDERIHSSSKKRGKDGTWNKRRGGPKGDELAAIEAELRAGMTGGNGPVPNDVHVSHVEAPQPTAPVPAPAPTPPMPAVTAEQTQPQPVPMPAPVPPMPTATAAEESSPTPAMPAPAAPAEQQQPAQPVASTGDMDFPTFMQQIGPKMGEGEGQINAAYLGAVCQMYGLESITNLALKPELIGTVVAQFAADGRW